MTPTAFLRRGGSFVWLAVAMLALGVGATTAIFSVVNGVVLRPLPFHDPGQLVLVGERAPQVPGLDRFPYFVTPAAYLAWQRRATDFTGLTALQGSSFTLTGTGRPQLLHGARVTSGFFGLFEVRPQLGRLFASADETDTSRPMVITDALWRSVFNADPGVIGRRVGVPGRDARIIGVLPADFRLSGRELGPMTAGLPTQFFLPLHFGPDSGGDLTSVFSNFNYTVIGRLRSGVTPSQALAQLNVIQADLARSAPEQLSLYARISTVRDYATAEARQELWLLLAGVGAVLLIICVNLGGLWTTRIAARRRDWAIRSALGATPGRLVRQILGESVALSLIGGVLGIVCAAAGLRVLLAAAPAGIPRLDEVHMDWRVLATGLALALLAGLVTGMVPALRLAHGDPQEDLKAGGAATTANRHMLRSRQILIGVQAALSTLLLVATGLLGLSFYQLMTRPAGFVAEHALAADVVINTYKDDQREQILRALPAALDAIPGVTSAGLTTHLPLQGEIWIDSAGVPGKVYTAADQPYVNVRFISPGYFATVGIPLLAGRDLAESDRPAGWPPKDEAAAKGMPGSVIISKTTARQLWPGVDPRDIVGRTITFNGGQTSPTVVGVAADALDGSLTSAPPAVVYQPYWQNVPVLGVGGRAQHAPGLRAGGAAQGRHLAARAGRADSAPAAAQCAEGRGRGAATVSVDTAAALCGYRAAARGNRRLCARRAQRDAAAEGTGDPDRHGRAQRRRAAAGAAPCAHTRGGRRGGGPRRSARRAAAAGEPPVRGQPRQPAGAPGGGNRGARGGRRGESATGRECDPY